MDGLASLLGLILIIAFVGVPLYKYRAVVKRYIKEPDYGSSFSVSRDKVLRRRIEDAQDELEWREKRVDTPDETPTED